MDLAELRTVHKREMGGWGGGCRVITGPLHNATCTVRKLISEPCWQSDYTAKQNLFFITLIFVYITKMLLVAIKLALGPLKNPVLVSAWLTSEGAGFYMLSLCGICSCPRFDFFYIHWARYLWYWVSTQWGYHLSLSRLVCATLMGVT